MQWIWMKYDQVAYNKLDKCLTQDLFSRFGCLPVTYVLIVASSQVMIYALTSHAS
jgi:3'-phosphoadenosine 5'-phosphosulfate sulfotransferase (PAPS reductase)/FAD synthetase